MPHPERASETMLGSDDGLILLAGFVAALADPVLVS
jgi:phosphoribosylformylglycinamidine (FGAM) synthase-like amidotransferase family enzyme